jgi:hypothetical protein
MFRRRKAICNVAEIMFCNNKGEKLSGMPIGTPGSFQDSDRTFYKAFDGDISTFYDALPDSVSWTGLDFGEAQTISEVRCLPRNEGNGIYESHIYELYCWSDTDWRFFERQTASLTPLLYFRVPTNALLYFKNATTDRSGRWFVVNKNGEQEWM